MASVLLALEDEKDLIGGEELKLGLTHLLPRLDEATDLVGGGDDILQAMTHLLGRCPHVPAPFKHTCHADQTNMACCSSIHALKYMCPSQFKHTCHATRKHVSYRSDT